MDKSWMEKPRNSIQYIAGLVSFLDFAFARNGDSQVILCPCPKCAFNKWISRDMVETHLLRGQFPSDYKIWDLHGELGEASKSSTNMEVPISGNHVDAMHELVNDAFGIIGTNGLVEQDNNEFSNPVLGEEDTIPPASNKGQTDPKSAKFTHLMEDGEKALYDGCKKFTKLSFIMRLYHIKYMHKVSEKAMSMILDLLREAFESARLPSSVYEMKKTIKTLGLTYTKIDACPNDCMLYWGNAIKEQSCTVCNTSRYKKTKVKDDIIQKKKQQPAKVFRYFPLIPRLQRMFMSSKSAGDMIWHSTDKSTDDLMRHPRDSIAWKNFDVKYPEFASDPRNVRLALASDGFNPYGNMATNTSIWPVVLIPYNTAPWLCMKQTSLLLSSIIPGKKQPGNDIDIYLGPLINELKTLWEGVETYDAAKKEMFTMKAALMWTISDFPGLDILSGWNTHTGSACPSCNFDTVPFRTKHSGKNCFMGSRRFLPHDHRFRQQRARFDRNIETRDPPCLLSGSEILEQVKNINVTFGKLKDPITGKKRPRENSKIPQQWKKCSIFFELPYWKFNLLRHNLDVMHIKKNVCDNILFTLLNDKDKRKDHLAARQDLVAMKIKGELWPDENGKCPAALFTLAKREIDTMMQTMKSMSVPDGYSSNISRCVDLVQHRMFGLKSHDSHIG